MCLDYLLPGLLVLEPAPALKKVRLFGVCQCRNGLNALKMKRGNSSDGTILFLKVLIAVDQWLLALIICRSNVNPPQED